MLGSASIPHLETLYDIFLRSDGVCTDSRTLRRNQVFFALKGPNFNGHQFVKQALENDAALVVIDEAAYKLDERCFLVENVLLALQDLARHHRRQYKIPFWGITGSNGKTTTKELVALVLQKRYKVHATKGNLNNHIGVPLTLLTMPPNAEVAIIEMGANKQGDIEELCRIAEPTHGLITSIGEAHIEGFGGAEGVLKGKTELYRFLMQRKQTILLNSQEPTLGPLAHTFGKPILYGQKGDFFWARFIEAAPYIVYEDERQDVVETSLIGNYNFQNILTALAIGKLFDVDSALANAAVAAYQPDNNRSQILRTEKNMLILDAYNANPTSMSAALKSFANMEGAQKTVILGDMLELGDITEAKHQALAEEVQKIGFSRCIFVGPRFKQYAPRAEASTFFENAAEARLYLETHPIAKSLVLLKGSRGIGLEKLVELL